MAGHSTPLGFSEPAPQIRGAGTLNSVAPPLVKILTWIVDLSLGLIAFSISFWFFWFSPKFVLLLLTAWVLISIAIRFTFILLFGASLGESLWNLRRRKIATSEETGIFWSGKIDSHTPKIATGVLMFVALLFVQFTFLRHPLWMRATEISIPTFLPQSEDSFKFAPFFFALGAWPTRFNEKPIFYSIPYEKGPPQQFIGHVVARWDMP